jgi:antirestriction protein
LYQEFVLALLECPKEKIQSMVDRGESDGIGLDLLSLWCYRVIRNMWCSSTSPFYKKYRKRYELNIEAYDELHGQHDYEYDQFLDEFIKQWDKTKQNTEKRFELMARLYAEMGSCRAIEKELGINFMTVNRYVNRFRKEFHSCNS